MKKTVPNPRDKGPSAAADVIIELPDNAIVLIERKFEPQGWAIPGGFIDYGESAEAAAVREAKEETGLDVELLDQLYTYSAADRDPRGHTLTVVYVGRASGKPAGADDAARAGTFTELDLPSPLAFDHASVLRHYFEYKRTGRRPLPGVDVS